MLGVRVSNFILVFEAGLSGTSSAVLLLQRFQLYSYREDQVASNLVVSSSLARCFTEEEVGATERVKQSVIEVHTRLPSARLSS